MRRRRFRNCEKETTEKAIGQVRAREGDLRLCHVSKKVLAQHDGRNHF